MRATLLKNWWEGWGCKQGFTDPTVGFSTLLECLKLFPISWMQLGFLLLISPLLKYCRGRVSGTTVAFSDNFSSITYTTLLAFCWAVRFLLLQTNVKAEAVTGSRAFPRHKQTKWLFGVSNLEYFSSFYFTPCR